MKEKRYLLVGVILGVLISWGIVFLSLPFILKKYSFLLGFIACLAFMSGVLLLLYVWERQVIQTAFFGKKVKAERPENRNRSYALLQLLVSVFIVLGVLLSCFYISKKNELTKSNIKIQDKKIALDAARLESDRNSSMLALMNHVLYKADHELKHNPKRELSHELIDRISDLSSSFKPYRSMNEQGTWSTNKLSPERGQLLLALAKMKLNTKTFNQIKFKTTFANADLKEADLKETSLENVDLREADLRDADLRDTDLREAKLLGANVWGANLSAANLSRADLTRAEMEWTNLTATNFKKANMQGANLSNSNLRGADLSGADFRWGFLDGATLEKAKFKNIKLAGSSFIRANLKNADLSNLDMKWTNFKEADLSNAEIRHSNFSDVNFAGTNLRGVNFTETILYRVTMDEENWFGKLLEWKVTGVDDIREKFRIGKDVDGEAKYRVLRVQ